jgi:hypothetical protein
MNIKNIMFITAIISCNIWQVLQAHEDILKQTPESQKVTVDTCQNRLEALAEEEKYQYFHTNICWAAAAGGIALILGGCLSENQNQSSKATNGGIAVLISSVLVGAGSVVNENYKAHHRRTERTSLLEQLGKVRK